MRFDSLAELKGYIELAIQDTLAEEVYTVVKEVMQENIESEVYSYTPSKYDRREYSGGLIADENISGTLSGNSLIVTNIAPPNPSPKGATTNKFLPAVIEFGIASQYDWYGYGHGGDYASPRPFTEFTRQDLAGNKQHIDALRDGLVRNGIPVK